VKGKGNTGSRDYPDSAGSLTHREVIMQQSLQMCSSQTGINEEIFVIPQEIFRALHPMEQLMARALERVGKVRIEKDDLTGR
jgi:hypothetical protein